MIGWRCRLCGTRGYDLPGLAGFWSHWLGWHNNVPTRAPGWAYVHIGTDSVQRPSIWDRTR